MKIETTIAYVIMLAGIIGFSSTLVVVYNIAKVRVSHFIGFILDLVVIGLAALFPYYLTLKLNNMTSADVPWWLCKGAPLILFGVVMLVHIGMGFYAEKYKRNANQSTEPADNPPVD
jgi:hypothetical protein